MKVIVAEHAGFCWGVKRAIEIATSTRQKVDDIVYVLGHLVHNEEVVRQLEKMDIKVIEDFADAKPGSRLLITAHGLDQKIIQEAKEEGFQVIDTTCPIVQKVHKFTRQFLDEGRKIIIIGHANHIEVKGIRSVADGQAQIVSSVDDIENVNFEGTDKVGVVAQTTFNIAKMQEIVQSLKKRFPNVDVMVRDSICHDVKQKQTEIKQLASQVNAVVVVGSKTSSNTTRLFEIAREVCSKTYFVSRAAELEAVNWGGVEKIAVTGGASTPDWIIGEVVGYLNSLHI